MGPSTRTVSLSQKKTPLGGLPRRRLEVRTTNISPPVTVRLSKVVQGDAPGSETLVRAELGTIRSKKGRLSLPLPEPGETYRAEAISASPAADGANTWIKSEDRPTEDNKMVRGIVSGAVLAVSVGLVIAATTVLKSRVLGQNLGWGPLAGATAVLLVWVTVIGSLGRLRRSALLVNEDNRVSTSKITALCWTTAVGFVMAYFLFLQWAGAEGCPGEGDPCTLPGLLGDTGLSTNYLLLLGAPFAALLGAQAITTAQVSDGTQQKTVSASNPTAAQAAQNDAGQGDLGDSQYLFFNLLAGLYFVITFVSSPKAGLPEIPTPLVALTSLSAATYLGKKFTTTNALDITGLDPPTPIAQEKLTIRGRNFLPEGARTVKVIIGQTPVVPDTVSNTQITLTMPPLNPANLDVEVITEAGSSKKVKLGADQYLTATLIPSPARPGGQVTLLLPRKPDTAGDGEYQIQLTSDSGYLAMEPAAQTPDNKLSFTFELPASIPAPTDRGKSITATLTRGGISIAAGTLTTLIPTTTVTPNKIDPGTFVTIAVPNGYTEDQLEVAINQNPAEALPGSGPYRVVQVQNSDSAFEAPAVLTLRKSGTNEVVARADITLLPWPKVQGISPTASTAAGARVTVTGTGLAGPSGATVDVFVGSVKVPLDQTYPNMIAGTIPQGAATGDAVIVRRKDGKRLTA